MNTNTYSVPLGLTIFAAGFAFGIVGSLSFGLNTYSAAVSVTLGAALLLSALYMQERALAIGCAVGCFAIALGTVRADFIPDVYSPVLESKVGTHVSLEGIVIKEVDRRENADRLVIATEGGRVLVSTDPYSHAEYGNRVIVQGLLEKPHDFETETGRLFAYEAYLEKDGIGYSVSRAKIAIEGGGEGYGVQSTLFSIKNAFLAQINALIPEPESALLGGLLLGSKQSLGKDLLEQFRIAGVIHIVVLSGFNMMIIASAALAVCRRFFSIRIALLLGSLSIFFFALMVGLSATVVRAGVMAEISLLALFLGRQYDLLRALLIAGVGMVFVSPQILLSDPSFQLSFLATLGLILLSPPIEKRLQYIGTQFGLREIVAATLATQIFLLPFLLWMTGTFSLVSLPANLLILPLIPVTMLLGFTASIFGFISYWLAFPFAYLAYALLSYEIWIATTLASIPFAAFTIPPFSFGWVIGVYVLGVILWYLHGRTRTSGTGHV